MVLEWKSARTFAYVPYSETWKPGGAVETIFLQTLQAYEVKMAWELVKCLGISMSADGPVAGLVEALHSVTVVPPANSFNFKAYDSLIKTAIEAAKSSTHFKQLQSHLSAPSALIGELVVPRYVCRSFATIYKRYKRGVRHLSEIPRHQKGLPMVFKSKETGIPHLSSALQLLFSLKGITWLIDSIHDGLDYVHDETERKLFKDLITINEHRLAGSTECDLSPLNFRDFLVIAKTESSQILTSDDILGHLVSKIPSLKALAKRGRFGDYSAGDIAHQETLWPFPVGPDNAFIKKPRDIGDRRDVVYIDDLIESFSEPAPAIIFVALKPLEKPKSLVASASSSTVIGTPLQIS
jgi:hypothetical protein